jgi:hypothetical protein
MRIPDGGAGLTRGNFRDYIVLTMKKTTIFLTLAVVAIATTSCFPFGFKPFSSDPLLVVDRPQHDFGAIPATDVVQTVFKVSNNGGKTLEISRIQTSCGCTAGMMDSQTIKPGGSSRLKVTFDPRGKHGRQARTLWLFSNDPKNPQQQLVIMSDIMALTPTQQPQIQIIPSATVTGNPATGGTATVQSITIPQPQVQTRSTPEPAPGLAVPAATTQTQPAASPATTPQAKPAASPSAAPVPEKTPAKTAK